MPKVWNILPRTEDDIVMQMLANRGVALQDRASFLEPSWEATHSPFLFTRMADAVSRVFAALEADEQIVIHGDYDADGVSGASLLYEAIREIRERLPLVDEVGRPSVAVDDLKTTAPQDVTTRRLPRVYLPDREKDGYGVAMHTIERLASEGAKLIITVDCGIANADQLDRAHELGMDVIVCDHHQLGDRLPAHAILLHPLVPGETYPNTTLCGTGVAFKFACGLFDGARKRGADFPEGHEKWFLDLVAIATVTDVMPLLGENRVLEYFGLKVLRKTRRFGLQAILTSSGTALDNVNTEDIGFRIGPRLNAAGRLASAEVAFRTITAPTMEDAVRTAGQLDVLNRQRQDIFAKAYEEAKRMIVGQENDSVLVVWKDDWLPGIVGLIAGRLAGDYGVPSFAFARVGDHYVGSGRTGGGLHLVEAMASCGDIFLKRGGHPQACGLSIASTELLEMFKARMSDFAHGQFNGTKPEPTIVIDAEVPLAACTWELLEQVQRCAPFGEGNRAPIFSACELEVVGAETMGTKKNHLRLTVYDDGKMVQLVGFGFGEWSKKLGVGSRVNAAYALEANEWNGKRTLQFRIIDIQPVA